MKRKNSIGLRHLAKKSGKYPLSFPLLKRFASLTSRITANLLTTVAKPLASKVVRACFIVAFFCSVSIWTSEAPIKTMKGLASNLFGNAESIAIGSAAVVFFLEIPNRKKRDQYEAWQVINLARGQTGSGGRIQALEDLKGDRVNLEGVEAPKAELSGIDLSRGKLNRANFNEAQLDFSILRGADLCDANLSNANLRDADLSNADLINANLSDANLNRASLSGAKLDGAYLNGAKLNGANLSYANLNGSKLNEARLSDAYLSDADLNEADLFGAKLNGANLSNANLRGADLSDADLSDADLTGAYLIKTDLSGANLSGANLFEANLGGVNLNGARGLTAIQLETALLCSTQLPEGITLNPNRDCERIVVIKPP